MDITPLDFLYLALAAGFISIVIFVNIILYNIIVGIRSANKTVKTLLKVTESVVSPLRNLKVNALRVVKYFIASIYK